MVTQQVLRFKNSEPGGERKNDGLLTKPSFFFLLLLDILTTESLTKLLRSSITLDETTQIKPRWVLKYNVFFKSRSIVADKG